MSLDFFQSLELIQGIQTPDSNVNRTMYSLEISENENLQKLFPIKPDGSTVQIQLRRDKDKASEKGRAFLHYNQNLCNQEIDNMINASNLVDPDPQDISRATNGDKAVCSQNKLMLTLMIIGDDSNSRQNVQVNFDSYQETIQKAGGDYRYMMVSLPSWK